MSLNQFTIVGEAAPLSVDCALTPSLQHQGRTLVLRGSEWVQGPPWCCAAARGLRAMPLLVQDHVVDEPHPTNPDRSREHA